MYLWLLTHHVILLLLTIGVFLLRCCCLLRNRSRIQIPRLYNATYNYHGWVLKLLCLNYFATLFYRWNWGLLLLWLVHHLHVSKLGWMLRWVLVISSFHYVLLLLLGRLSYTNVILQLWLHNLIHLTLPSRVSHKVISWALYHHLVILLNCVGDRLIHVHIIHIAWALKM